MKKETFIEITNEDIFDELRELRKELGVLCERVSVTNGKVKAHEKLIYTIMGILVTVIGWFVYHLIG